ncbi:MAG: type II toxin-antitoxin system VapC family toxin [Egibacteraceae bacterium]
MSVCDASLVTDALIAAGPHGDAAIARILQTSQWHAPHLLPAEVMSALRGLVRGRHVSRPVAQAAQARLRSMRLTCHPFDPYNERAWELRENATPYDAWFVAMAEALAAPLVTTDAKLGRIPGIRCQVEVIAGS